MLSRLVLAAKLFRRDEKGLFVNATVEHLGPCKKLIRVEVDPQTVDKAFAETTSHFAHRAVLPGFRPGKVPLHLIVKTFAAKIENEVKKNLMSEAYTQALKEHRVRQAATPEVEEIQFGRGQSFQFTVTLESFPEFNLPPYKGIAVTREVGQVTDGDVERALNSLREQNSTYNDVSRPVQLGDYVIVNYKATCEGKPLTDFSSTLSGLAERENLWMHIAPGGSAIPGLPEQLIGATEGETRVAKVTFPSDFPVAVLVGKDGDYTVQVLKVKERLLPEVNDEFAKLFKAQNLDHLCQGVRQDLEKELSFRQKRGVRDQLIKSLTSNVQFELPESVVVNETNNVVYDIVRENQERGITPEAIDKHKDEIYAAANTGAKDRLKVGMILGKIAEVENIRAERDEINLRIRAMAVQNKVKLEKMAKQLMDSGGINQIADQIVSSKVLDFLELHAQVTDVITPSTLALSPQGSEGAPSA